MFRFLFSLPVFLLSLLMLFSGGLAAETLEGAEQALHLLGYLAADYPSTVDAGVVVDNAEYGEQLEFAERLQGLILALPPRAGRAGLVEAGETLARAIAAKAPGEQVGVQARRLAERLAAEYEVVRSPSITPDATRGAPLFAQHCAVCHGERGRGDGPAGIGMEPAPADLTDRTRLDRLSLYDLFSTIGLGVEGTDMPGFADQLNERQRWDLAAQVAGLSADPLQAKGAPFALARLASDTPVEVAAREGEARAAAFRLQRAQPPVVQRGPQQLIDYTRQTLDESLAAYQAGEQDQAYDLSVAAYLEGFELVESALDNLDPALRRTTEKALMGYRQALLDRVEATQAQQRLADAEALLAQCRELLGENGLSPTLSFVSALLILLREGVEAILVLAAVLAYLRNTGQQAALRSVHVGWSLALLAGVGTWALAAYAIDISGAQRELMEGITALFASVVLLWVGVWMHDRRHAAAWQASVRSRLGEGGRFGFAVLAFFAVYRELFEVILFYETLWLQAGSAGQSAVIAGALVALGLLLGVAWVILRGARQLPLATFFSANAVLLCVLSVVFAGHGVVALQEAGVIGTRPVPFFEVDLLGIHADAWSLSAQALALAAVAALYARSRRAERQRAGLPAEQA
ncbi:cytochrome c/FTR1 family iron permease [Stutzerimonas azotifigens]|uniref:cytochrome c/FTR1 family iron permease n=1 Tax=Stutzerimonas azotifigens TaxID=291995 RepID=UPI0009FD4BDD|nr:cytochrome c/FTR1 family iron permease [Stutzerimonas azotifigens]